MNDRRVEYHEGASADVKSAVTWYQKRSPKAALDFIEELQRAVDTIREAPDRWPPGKNGRDSFCFGDFLLRSSTQNKNPQSSFGEWPTAADDRSIGHRASNNTTATNL